MSTEDILETFHFHVLKRFLSVSVKLSALFLRRLKHVTGLLGSDAYGDEANFIERFRKLLRIRLGVAFSFDQNSYDNNTKNSLCLATIMCKDMTSN